MFHLRATAVLYQRKFKAGCINQEALQKFVTLYYFPKFDTVGNKHQL